MTKTWWVLVVSVISVAVMGGCASSATDEPPVEAPASQPPAQTPTPAADEKPPVNTLKWTTASEVDNFGFDIYRSLSEEGPFDRITKEPMLGAGTTDEPQRYVFVDEDIDPTKDYYYYIESITLGGVREKFSPVIRSPAKHPVEPEAD